jgi:hypothetical protein
LQQSVLKFLYPFWFQNCIVFLSNKTDYTVDLYRTNAKIPCCGIFSLAIALLIYYTNLSPQEKISAQQMFFQRKKRNISDHGKNQQANIAQGKMKSYEIEWIFKNSKFSLKTYDGTIV